MGFQKEISEHKKVRIVHRLYLHGKLICLAGNIPPHSLTSLLPSSAYYLHSHLSHGTVVGFCGHKEIQLSVTSSKIFMLSSIHSNRLHKGSTATFPVCVFNDIITNGPSVL